MLLALRKRLAAVRRLFRIRKSKTTNRTATTRVESSSSSNEETIGAPIPRSEEELLTEKALPALPSLLQETRIHSHDSRSCVNPLDPQQLSGPFSESEWYRGVSQYAPGRTQFNTVAASFAEIVNQPDTIMEASEEASIEALSYNLKDRSVPTSSCSSFTSSSDITCDPPLNQDGISFTARTGHQGLYNMLGLSDGFYIQKNANISNMEKGKSRALGGNLACPTTSRGIFNPAGASHNPTATAGTQAIGGLWTPVNQSSKDMDMESIESAAYEYIPPKTERPRPFLPATPSPIGIHSLGQFSPPPGSPSTTSRTPSPTEPAKSPPYKFIYLDDTSPSARRRSVLVGKGASAEVFRISSLSGMYRAKKIVNLARLHPVSLEALQNELTVLTILRRDQFSVMHCMKRPEIGFEFVMQIPQDISQYIMIDGRAKKLTMCFEYYPESLEMFTGRIPKNSQHPDLMRNVMYFLISEITQGLSYLHRLGIIHMDLKPENVFLTPSRHCVIGDFGGAVYRPNKIYPWQAGMPSWRQTFTTHGFRAPEVTAAKFNYHAMCNCKADFWSLGVSMYKLLVPDGVDIRPVLGVPIADLGNDYEEMGLVPKIMRRRMLDAGCPREIVDLILNMTQYNPRWRMGEIGITRFLKDRNINRYYQSKHPSPLQLVTPQVNLVGTSNYEKKFAPSGSDPGSVSFLNPGKAARSLVDHMNKYCNHNLFVHFAKEL